MVPATKMRAKAHDKVPASTRATTSALRPKPLHTGFVMVDNGEVARSAASIDFINQLLGTNYKVVRSATPEEVDQFFQFMHERAHAMMTAFDQLPHSIREVVRDILGEPEEVQAVLNCYLAEGELK